jgi:hypothetical protein
MIDKIDKLIISSFKNDYIIIYIENCRILDYAFGKP